jgi:hypothetical protein
MLAGASDDLRRYLTDKDFQAAECARLHTVPEDYEPGLVLGSELTDHIAADKVALLKDAAAARATVAHNTEDARVLARLVNPDFVATMKLRHPDAAYPIPGQEPEADWLLGIEPPAVGYEAALVPFIP